MHVDRQSIVSCINCNISSIDECIVNDSAAKFTNCVMSRSIEDYVPLLSINNSSVSFNGCRFICPTDLFYLQTSVIFDFKDSNISLNESELIVINSNDNIKNNILTNCEISYNHFYAHINNISGTTIKTELWEEYE